MITVRIFRPKAAAAYLGVSVSTLYEWSAKGILPPPIKLTKNGRASGHPIEVLDELIERQISESRGQTT